MYMYIGLAREHGEMVNERIGNLIQSLQCILDGAVEDAPKKVMACRWKKADFKQRS